MFSIEVRADADDDVAAELAALRDFRPDLAGAIPKATAAIQASHQHARAAGLDNRGNPLAPLAASTLKHRDGTGPALTPHDADSRAVRNFIATAEPTPAGLAIQTGYIAMPWLKYHTQGAGRLPVRDIEGVPASVLPTLDGIVAAEADDQLRQILSPRRRGLMGRIGAVFTRKR